MSFTSEDIEMMETEDNSVSGQTFGHHLNINTGI